jgi:predicted ribosome quality control (RQC) complex YloA/Tae2 family protein
LSLNWREIDAVLEEIPLENSLIRDIYQPSHPRLVLELYNRGLPLSLLFSFSNPDCRLHLLSRKLPKPAKPPRFVSFLRAHIRGGRILSVEQIDQQRIVRIEVKKGDRSVILWSRLWAAAANMIVTDSAGIILDALYRRPKRGEISGGHYSVERDIGPAASPASRSNDKFSLRDLPGPGSFNERIEKYYFDMEETRETVRLRDNLLDRLRREENRLLASSQNLEKRMERYREFEIFKKWGDLILSNIHTLNRGDRWLTIADSENPDKTWDIELDRRATPAQNAESYYKRYRKAKTGLNNLEEEFQQHHRKLQQVLKRIAELEAGEVGKTLESLRQEAGRGKKMQGGADRESPPGLSFTSGGFRILVGRNARENDALLRRFIRGNDTWLHARDYPGAYVFIRSIPGKSIPLEILLDAATLALVYSKAKDSGQGDVFYTQVKYLKRVKEAKTGLVIPTQEKNLHVEIDPNRLRRLQKPRA